MSAKYYIKAGFVKSTASAKPSANITGPNQPLTNGVFDLHRWLRNELAALGVANRDACCTTGQTIFPIQFNSATSHMEKQNLDGTWTAIAGF